MSLPAACYGPEAVGARRLAALVKGLPPGGALHRALDPAAAHRWGWTEELLALLVQVSDYGNRMFYAAHSAKKGKGPKPVKVRRPWEHEPATSAVSPAKRQATADEIQRFFSKGGR